MSEGSRCHPGLVRTYRERRGWTQLDLAGRADCSERLVRKAEAGEVIRAGKLQQLAEALATPDEPLTAGDLTNDPMAVAQSFVRAYLAHGVEAARKVAHLFARNVVLAIHSDAPELGFVGEFHGVEGIDRMMRAAYQQFEPVEKDFGRWFRDGARVAALRRDRHHPIGSPPGTVFDSWMLHEYTIHDGLLARIDNYIDSQTWVRSLTWGGPSDAEAAANPRPG